MLGLGLIAFNKKDETIQSFKPYYLLAYYYSIKDRITNSTEANSIRTDSNAKSVPILLYHGILNKSDGSNVSLKMFNEQMKALKKEGYQTITLSDYIGFIQKQKTLPDKSFLLTFDDGRKDSYYPVDPILKSLNFNAVMFVITGDVGTNRFYLNNSELKKMIATDRWEIDSHGQAGHDLVKINAKGDKGHFLSNKLWLEDENRLETEKEYKDRITKDFLESRNSLKTNLGIDPLSFSFAFPYGDYGQDSINYPKAMAQIFETVKDIYPISFFQTNSGESASNYPNPQAFMAKRITINPNWDENDLVKVLAQTREKELPYLINQTFSPDQGWVAVWGGNDYENGLMTVEANYRSTGSLVFLNGTNSWQDYEFKSNVIWRKGSNFLVLVRYKDDMNYVAFNISDNTVRIEEKVNNVNKVLKEVKQNFNFPKENLDVMIRIKNNTLECLVENQSIATAETISHSFSSGGIGFKTWDQILYNSELVVKMISITPIK